MRDIYKAWYALKLTRPTFSWEKIDFDTFASRAKNETMVGSIFGKCEILLSFVGNILHECVNDSVVLSSTFDQLCLLYVQMKRSNKVLATQIENARHDWDIYNFVKKWNSQY